MSIIFEKNYRSQNLFSFSAIFCILLWFSYFTNESVIWNPMRFLNIYVIKLYQVISQKGLRLSTFWPDEEEKFPTTISKLTQFDNFCRFYSFLKLEFIVDFKNLAFPNRLMSPYKKHDMFLQKCYLRWWKRLRMPPGTLRAFWDIRSF